MTALTRPAGAAADQILSIAAMREAEAALIAGGASVESLMHTAGTGAAEYVWRMAAGRAVTVLCGPGNNGGDGYVIAEALRTRGGDVAVIAPVPPATAAARAAAAAFKGAVLPAEAVRRGAVFVDALFGVGLTRPVGAQDMALVCRLAATHAHAVAIDVPSGVDGDTGNWLADGHEAPPRYDLTIALGAWKGAHALMPAVAAMGALRLVDIGVGLVAAGARPDPFGPGRMLRAPRTIAAPAADAHKYTRGCLCVVAGVMSGAAILAARAAQGAGAGYVRIAAARSFPAPADMVVAESALGDPRTTAILCGPGLGRDDGAKARLEATIEATFALRTPMVLDADALMLLRPRHLHGRGGLMPQHPGAAVLTPHEGELEALEKAWDLPGRTTKGAASGKVPRALALAAASGAVVVAKGPDTVIAAPGGQWIVHAGASAWLSTAGTGDVLAGAIASRLATGVGPFAAAAQGVWLQAEAARIAGVGFHAMKLADAVAPALALAIGAR